MSKKVLGYLLAGLLLAGCNPLETAQNVYQGRSLPARIDFDKGTGLKQKEQKLAQALSETDEKIEKLRMTLDRQGTPPSLSWMQDTGRSMPWLNGLLVLDSQGREVRRYPQAGVKKLDLQEIHQEILAAGPAHMRLLPQTTEFGPEVCMVKPFFYQGAHQGTLLAHFDFRTLVSADSQGDDLIVFFPGTLLWSGDYGPLARELSRQDWDRLVAKDIQGEITVGERTFYWLVRYVGLDPLIYAVGID
ncbi:MAG: hypothetical protein K9K79_01515 [Desulfohalobiaceae bacterium]|nr:hypothetical protein [Desulfohalobiaceae bacterium]